MYYAIMGEDAPDSLDTRLSVRPAHLERIEDLVAAGRLLIAGPHPAVDKEDPGAAGFSGSLIIAEFDSMADAKAWADADPYVTEGVFQRVHIKPFKLVAP